MLRNFELIVVWMIAVVCMVGTGCSSFRLPDADEFATEKSRLVDMRNTDLDSLVQESSQSKNESADELSLADDSDVVVQAETDSTAENPLPEEEADTRNIGQVNHADLQAVRFDHDQQMQTLEPLSNGVLPGDSSSEPGQGLDEKIIILKAKSPNPYSISEMIEKSANPASPMPEIADGHADEVQTSIQLTPIGTGAGNPSVYSNFKPGKLVCGAECDCDACQAKSTKVQVSSGSAPPDQTEVLPSSADPLTTPTEGETVTADAVEGVSLANPESVEVGDSDPTSVEDNQFDPGQIEPDPPSATGHADSVDSQVEPENSEPVPSKETGESIAAEPLAMNVENASLGWDVQLKATIDAFEDQIIDLAMSDYRRPQLQQSLAILHVLDDRLSSGRIALEQPKHRQYWQHQLTAILNMLQAAKTNEEGGRQSVSTAMEHLKSAVIELQQLSELSIARIEFCSGVSGYGQFVTMDVDEFQPDSTTLVYCEIENFLPVKETVGDREMFATRLECQLEILDQDDNVVQSVEFPVVEDVAINHRRDFYMHLPLTLANLPPGSYAVKLDVKDLGSQKSAKWSTVEALTVK